MLSNHTTPDWEGLLQQNTENLKQALQHIPQMESNFNTIIDDMQTKRQIAKMNGINEEITILTHRAMRDATSVEDKDIKFHSSIILDDYGMVEIMKYTDIDGEQVKEELYDKKEVVDEYRGTEIIPSTQDEKPSFFDPQENIFVAAVSAPGTETFINVLNGDMPSLADPIEHEYDDWLLEIERDNYDEKIEDFLIFGLSYESDHWDGMFDNETIQAEVINAQDNVDSAAQVLGVEPYENPEENTWGQPMEQIWEIRDNGTITRYQGVGGQTDRNIQDII